MVLKMNTFYLAVLPVSVEEAGLQVIVSDHQIKSAVPTVGTKK